MTNREAAEYLVRDFEDVRDLLNGIAKTRPKTCGRKPSAEYVTALSVDGKSKATIVLSQSTVTALHAAEFDETYQVWNNATLNLGPTYNPHNIPVQIQYHDDVRLPRIGLGVETLDDIPAEVCSRLYGAVALFGTVETT